MIKTLYLIRHGQASAGTTNYDRLSEKGIRQSKLLGDYKLQQQQLPEEIWSGSLQRQQQTAQHFMDSSGLALPVRTEMRLNEYDHRAIHSLYHPAHISSESAYAPDTDLAPDMSFEIYENIITNWSQDKSQPAGVESWLQFKYRCLSALRDIATSSDAQSIALFTSGGVISVITAQLQQRQDSDIPKQIWDLSNASLNTVRFESTQLTVLDLNQVPHLETDPSMITKI